MKPGVLSTSTKNVLIRKIIMQLVIMAAQCNIKDEKNLNN